jgi:Flp pilus assembly protein TadG
MRLLSRHPKRTRRGILSLELAAALPILMAVLAATVEFSLLLSAQGTLADASRSAVRAAALGVRDEDQLLATAQRALGPRLGASPVISLRDDETTGTVSVVVRVPMRSAAPNLLWPVGYDLSGRYLTASASMASETN